MAKLGLIPKSAAEAVKKRGRFDIDRIDGVSLLFPQIPHASLLLTASHGNER